jgi:hypothetical protein
MRPLFVDFLDKVVVGENQEAFARVLWRESGVVRDVAGSEFKILWRADDLEDRVVGVQSPFVT